MYAEKEDDEERKKKYEIPITILTEFEMLILNQRTWKW